MGTRQGLSLSWLRTTVVAGSLAIASFVLLSANSQTVLWTNAVNVAIVNSSLSHGDTDTTSGDIDFVSRFNGGGSVVLRESQTAPQCPAPPSGGFLEKSGSQTYRGRFTRDQILGFLPANEATGPFKFPAPYGTTAVRLTNAADCGGTDCLAYVGYWYWRNTNSTSAGRRCDLPRVRSKRGRTWTVSAVLHKATDQVQNLGPLFPDTSAYSYATGEGWYFSGSQATKLYTYLVGDGAPAIRRAVASI